MTWRELAVYLSRASPGAAKDEAGAWSPALYDHNVRRKGSLVRIHAMVVDIDENGDVDQVADALARYAAIVHETFSSTSEAPRCRAVLLLAGAIDASTYEETHRVLRAHFLDAGIVADEGAKDASRLSYSPVRRPGAPYRCRTVDGAPLDAAKVLAAQPPRPAPAPPPAIRPGHADAYVRAALTRAADAVSSAGEGIRHYTLSREAFALARLGLSDAQIESVLLPAFVAAAGERREREGARTIQDAIKARRGAA
jgi:hypothetical protein